MALFETILDTGDEFPHVDLKLINGSTARLPEVFASSWGVLLMYRGTGAGSAASS